jgi:hypothetical protein
MLSSDIICETRTIRTLGCHFEYSKLLKFYTNDHLSTSLYDKRDDCNIAIINIPHLDSNILPRMEFIFHKSWAPLELTLCILTFPQYSSSSNTVHPSVVLSIIEIVLCTFTDTEACDKKTCQKCNIYSKNYDVNVYTCTRAISTWTPQVWEHYLSLLASYSMFGLLKDSMSIGGSIFSRMVLNIFGHGLLLLWWLQK